MVVVGGFSKEDSWEEGKERERESKRKKEQVLSVDATDHFERRCLISFEIACARPTAMLWSLSILH